MTERAGATTAAVTARRTSIGALPPWAWLLVALTAVCVAIGAGVRLSLLGAGSLWLDELWTLDAISRSLKELVGARLITDSNPPLWTSLAWFWLRLVGTYDSVAMRLLPLGFSLFAIAAPLAGALRLRSLRPALLVMAALLALSLLAIQFAVELRSYSMLIALGTAATVVWAGLLVGDLPARGRWIFLFALAGALAGFSHYYGILLYFGEAVVLLLAWMRTRAWRSVGLLVAWGILSLLPGAAWLALSFGRFPAIAVGYPPSLETIQTWLAYASVPLSNVVADHGPGYPFPDGPLSVEAILVVLTVVAIVGAAAIQLARRPGERRISGGSALVGAAALTVVGIGLAISSIASLVLPPSMNYRNLAALAPTLFLAVGCAATLAANERTRWLTGSAVVAMWLLAAAVFTSRNGVPDLAPAWQRQAGYRAGAEALLAASAASPRPTLVGLDTSWGWHGQWDAALRSALRSAPAESSDPAPLAIRWVGNVEEVQAGGLPAGPVLVVADSFDARQEALLAWLEQTRGPCRESQLGGPAFGMVILRDCP